MIRSQESLSLRPGFLWARNMSKKVGEHMFSIEMGSKGSLKRVQLSEGAWEGRSSRGLSGLARALKEVQ